MAPENETVLLLHGIFQSRWIMKRLEWDLKKRGYKVANWSYRSLSKGIPEIIDSLSARLPELGNPTKLHAIGHSMGGLILRHIFAQTTLPKGRLVLLGTPSKGAKVVAYNKWLAAKFIPGTIRDMHPEADFIKTLPLPKAEIGVIAGVEPFSPINPSSWLNKEILGDVPHDGTVELSSVKIEGCECLELPVNHTLLPLSGKVIAPAIHFIETGHFQG